MPFWAFLRDFAQGRPLLSPGHINYKLNFFVWANPMKTASNGFHPWGKAFAGFSERFGSILIQAVIWWAQVKLWAELFRQQTPCKWLQMVLTLRKNVCRPFWAFRGDSDAVIWWAQVKLWAERFCVTKTLENGFKWFLSLGKNVCRPFWAFRAILLHASI